MRQIICSIVKKHASVGNWLKSEAIVDTVRVYIYCYGDELDEVLKVELDQMVENQDGLAQARQLKMNLEETHMKMRENVKSKLAKYLELLLEVPSEDKFHWRFALILDPRYVKSFKDFRKMHEIETVDTRTIINEMMPKFYDYVVA